MEDKLDIMIAKLHDLKGPAFWQQLQAITRRREFQVLEEGIFSAIGPDTPDFNQLLEAARKAVYFGYTAYLLPNPRTTRSADFIFVRKGIYKLIELKTIYGRNSIRNRLNEASGQSSRILLNLATRINPHHFAHEIVKAFEQTPSYQEIIIFIRRKAFSITRQNALKEGFEVRFRKAVRK